MAREGSGANCHGSTASSKKNLRNLADVLLYGPGGFFCFKSKFHRLVGVQKFPCSKNYSVKRT